MTAKEQAEDLVGRFTDTSYGNTSITRKEFSKINALILVNEIIKQWGYAYSHIGSRVVVKKNICELEFWGMVKVEINNL